ncbi:MAG: amidase [Pseudomonadales bacterium]|jgi:aspartyl-tRNA(Asn)/glutamyl-tRNA(Gln) amidotransferase subunit A|nr:amidase [Pseudomonadales bacterium]
MPTFEELELMNKTEHGACGVEQINANAGDVSVQAAPLSRRTVLLSGLAAAGAGLMPAFSAAQTAGEELTALTLAEAARRVRAQEVSPVDLTHACLARIERLNPALNAFITVAAEQALAAAQRAEGEIRAGNWKGPLHGIPFALKDIMDTAGIRTTGASELFENRVPTDDSEVARRLKEAGGVLLGKLNLNEFAYGGSATATHFGTMHNPWNLDHATGGSSGGSAVAIAADLCFGTLGTDTAGSVRMPASQCGIVGLKPTYGRVSTRGVMMLSWTLDHVGPMCKSVEDVALMLNLIAGYDPLEPTSSREAVPDYTRALGMNTAGLRLGIAREGFFENLDPEVESALNQAIEVLRSLTASTRELRLPAATSGARLWGPEAYAYHAPYFTVSPEKYQPSTRAALERYANAPALDYVQARREVDLLRQSIGSVFADVDLLIAPVMRTPAPLLSEGGGGGVSANAAAFDVFGLPAISVPCGFTREGLPIGIQIIGAHFDETRVLALAAAYEQQTQWRQSRRPAL